MKEFKTETSRNLALKKTLLTTLSIYIVIALISALSISVTIPLFIILEIIVLLGAVYAFFMMIRKAFWSMRFEGNKLYITPYKSEEEYYVYDIGFDDFMFSQSKAEKKQDCATLFIKTTNFYLPCIRNYTELLSYIKENYA